VFICDVLTAALRWTAPHPKSPTKCLTG